MVHPLNPHHIAPGRDNQPNGSRICGHAHWLQYIFPAQTTDARLLIFSHLAWFFELTGGAIGDFENPCLPKEQREATFTVAALHQWDLGIDDPKCVTTAEGVGHCPFPTQVQYLTWLV